MSSVQLRMAGLALAAPLALLWLVPARAHAGFANGFSIQVRCVEDLSASDSGFGTWRARFVATNTTSTAMTLTGANNEWIANIPEIDPGDPPTVFPAGTEVEWVTDPMPKRNNRGTTPGWVQWNLATPSGARAEYRGSPRCYQAPTLVRGLTVAGSPTPGGVLTASGEEVKLPQGNYTTSVSWLRDCDDPSSFDYVSGRSYVVRPQDVGHRLQATVIYGDSTGGGVSTETPCDDGALIRSAPSATAAPSITGAPVVGRSLSVTGGAWAGDGPLTQTVRWEACDTTTCADAGAKPTYTPVPADLGRTIRAVVTQTSAWGTASVTTASTNAVRDASPPQLTPDPDRLDFGSLAVGRYSAARSVRLTNDGGTDLQITALTSVSEFPITTTCSTTQPLAPGASCQVSVKFHPRYSGSRSSTLTLRSNDPSGARSVQLTGAGA